METPIGTPQIPTNRNATLSSQHTHAVPLWPAWVLWGMTLAVQAGLLAWLAATQRLLITPLSMTVVTGMIATSLLLLALRPTASSLVAAAIALQLAGIVLIPFDPMVVPAVLAAQPAVALDGGLIMRTANLALIAPTLILFTDLFPRPRLHSLAVYAILYAATAGLVIVITVGQGRWRLMSYVFLLVMAVCLLGVAVARMVRASRGTTDMAPHEVMQARLIFFSVLLAEVPTLIRPVWWLITREIIPYEFSLLAQMILPAGIAYAILRHNLFGIDAALRRGLVYALVSGILLAIYLGATALLAGLLITLAPSFQGLMFVAALLAAAAAFGPLQRLAQRMIDQALYPERLRFATAIAGTRAQLDQVLSRHELLHLLEIELPAQLGARWGTLVLAPAPESLAPGSSTAGWTTALKVGDKVLGRYWLGQRDSGLRYDEEERAQLHTLLQQAALALAYGETAEALRKLNQELESRVEARTAQLLDQQRTLAIVAERQRLARDLHDSVTQMLFSINLGARAIRKLVQRDPAAAEAALAEQERAAQEALAEMRSLLAQLRSPVEVERTARVSSDAGRVSPTPPATQSGDALVERLRAYCERVTERHGLTCKLEVTTMLPALPRIAEEIFLIAREAVHNAVKHSNASVIHCLLTVTADQIQLAVDDNGRGFDPGTIDAGAFGIRGMRERTAQLAGKFELQSEPGQGTTVRVTVPTSYVLDPPGSKRTGAPR